MTQEYTYRRNIFIKDLDIACIIGVHAYEREKKQMVRINVSLSCDGQPIDDDKLTSTVDYESLYKEICTLVETSEYSLLETLSYHIAKLCVEREKVVKACVQIEKLDVFPLVKSVGVETIVEK